MPISDSTTPATHTCERCGVRFRPSRNSSGRYCSRACGGRYPRHTISLVSRSCRHCGKPFQPSRTQLKRGTGFYCSIHCRSKDKRQAQPRRNIPEYRIWKAMRTRCSNPRQPCWKNYGGRGITVSPEWDSFERFYADMGPRPSPMHSIDRRDNNGPYCAANCGWATRSEQEKNKRKPI